jgi:large subunit ribosomal protein L30
MIKKAKQLKVTLKRSLNKRLALHKACVAGLGLRRIGHTVMVSDTPEIRGMISKVAYMVAVEDA